MCTVLLPPGDNPIAVNKYISYIILYATFKSLLSLIICRLLQVLASSLLARNLDYWFLYMLKVVNNTTRYKKNVYSRYQSTCFGQFMAIIRLIFLSFHYVTGSLCNRAMMWRSRHQSLLWSSIEPHDREWCRDLHIIARLRSEPVT